MGEVIEATYKNNKYKISGNRVKRTLTISETAFKKIIDLCEIENKSINAMVESVILNYNKKEKVIFNKCKIKYGEEGF